MQSIAQSGERRIALSVKILVAVRRPRVSMRGDLWIALLGPTVEKGIVGIGSSVEAALHDFRHAIFGVPGTGDGSDEKSRFSLPRS